MNIYRLVLYMAFLIAPCFALSGCAKPDPDEIPKSVAQLLEELNNSDPEIRERAARKFSYVCGYYPDAACKTRKSEIIAALKKCFNDENIHARHSAADALMDISPADNEDFVVSFILRELEDTNPETRAIAASRIGSYYWHDVKRLTPKEETINALKRHLNDENIEVRYYAAVALGRIGPLKFQKLILPVFIEILDSDVKRGKIYSGDAAHICKEIGPAAADAVPALIKVARETEPKHMFVYAEALKSIGTPEALAAAEEAERAKKMWHLGAVMLNCAIMLAYILFFAWSVRLRRKGKKVFHWFLLVPVVAYLWNLPLAVEEALDMDRILSIKFFLAFAFIGCAPWLISWYWLRRQKTNP